MGERRVRMPTFVIGLVAVALVAGLVGRGLLFGDGGASSPEGAVRDLGAAISNEDLVGALATLAPDEVRDAADTYTTASTKLKALGVTPQTKTLGGIDLDVSGLELKTSTLGPDVAKVEIEQGTFSYKVSEQQLGPKAQQSLKAHGSTRRLTTRAGSKNLAKLTYRGRDGARHRGFLIAVQRDGGWYVSPFYTVAELVDSHSDKPGGDFSPIHPGSAAPTPTAAVEELVTAINRRDVDGGIDSLSADEWAVLRSYRAAIHVAVDRKLARSNPDNFQIESSKFSSQPINDSAQKVFIESMSGHVITNEVTQKDEDAFENALDQASDSDSVPDPPRTRERINWSYADGCLRIDDPDQPYDSCSTTGSRFNRFNDPVLFEGGLFGVLGGDSVAGDATAAFGSRPYVVVIAERGGWAVSPVATLTSWLRGYFDRLDANKVARLTGSELDTPATVTATADKAVDVRINSGGFATIAYSSKAGVPFRVWIDGARSLPVKIRRPDGRAEDSDFYDDGLEFASVAGTYRLAIEGVPGRTVSVKVDALADPPTLSPGQSTLLHFGSVDEPQVVKIVVQPGEQVEVTTSDGQLADIYTSKGEFASETVGATDVEPGSEPDPLTARGSAATFYVVVEGDVVSVDPADGLEERTIQHGGGLTAPADVTITAVDKLAVARFAGGETTAFADLQSPIYDGWVREASPTASYHTTFTIPSGAADTMHLQSPSIADLTVTCRAGATTSPTSVTTRTPTAGDDVEDLSMQLPIGPQSCDATVDAVYQGGSIKLSLTP